MGQKKELIESFHSNRSEYVYIFNLANSHLVLEDVETLVGGVGGGGLWGYWGKYLCNAV